MALVSNHRYHEPHHLKFYRDKVTKKMVPAFPRGGFAGSNWDGLALFGLTRSAVDSSYKPAKCQVMGHDAGGNLRTERDDTSAEKRWLPPESRIPVPDKVTAYKKPRVTSHLAADGRRIIVPVFSYAKGRGKGKIATGVIFSDEEYHPDVETSPADMVLTGPDVNVYFGAKGYRPGNPAILKAETSVMVNEKTGERKAKFSGNGVRSNFQAKRINARSVQVERKVSR